MSKLIKISFDNRYLKHYGLAEFSLGAATIGCAEMFVTPFYFTLCFGFFVSAWGIRRCVQYMVKNQMLHGLDEGNFFNVDIDEVQNIRWEQALTNEEKLKQKEEGIKEIPQDHFLLGAGYVWDVRHVTWFQQIKSNPDIKKYVKKKHSAGGKAYLHNLGIEEEEPQVLHLQEHTMIAGETGSGKTVLLDLLVAQMIADGDAVCIIDPKGDQSLLDSVYSRCLQFARPQDFIFFSLPHPTKSASFDAFANTLNSKDAAYRITSTMPQDGKSKPFVDFCWMVLNTVGEVLKNSGRKVNLKNLHRYSLQLMTELVTDTEIALRNIKDEKQRAALEDSLGRLKMLDEHDEGHFSKMILSLEPIMTSLATGEVGEILSPEHPTITWEKIIRGKKVVYFNLASMVDDYTASTVGKLIIQDLLSYVGQMYAYDKTKSRLKLICDEFYSVSYPGFLEVLNKSRAAGLQAFLGMQTSADIAATMDVAMMEAILGNLPNKIYLRVGQEKLAKEFADLFGEVKVANLSFMRNVSANPKSSGELFNTGMTERWDEKDTPLVSSDMIKSLPQGQAFIHNKGMDPVKLRIPILKKEKRIEVSYFDDILNKSFVMNEDDYKAPADALGLDRAQWEE